MCIRDSLMHRGEFERIFEQLLHLLRVVGKAAARAAPVSYTHLDVYKRQVPSLKEGLSLQTYQAAYAPFTPNHSGQRLPPTYYRGCWHVVSRGFLLRYRHFFLPLGQKFTIRKPSSLDVYKRQEPARIHSPHSPAADRRNAPR